MDPQVTWNELVAAYKSQQWEIVEQCAIDLLTWLLRGGFPPVTGGNRMTTEEHRTAAREFSIYAYAVAVKEQGHDVAVDYELKEDQANDA